MLRVSLSGPFSPLSSRDIAAVFSSIAAAPGVDADIALTALTATATSMRSWCGTAAINAAMPIPQCVHGRPWNDCADCGTAALFN